MYHKSKEYINTARNKKNNISQKTNCFFDIITTLKQEKQRYQIQNSDYNHNHILAGVYLVHKKIA